MRLKRTACVLSEDGSGWGVKPLWDMADERYLGKRYYFAFCDFCAVRNSVSIDNARPTSTEGGASAALTIGQFAKLL